MCGGLQYVNGWEFVSLRESMCESGGCFEVVVFPALEFVLVVQLLLVREYLFGERVYVVVWSLCAGMGACCVVKCVFGRVCLLRWEDLCSQESVVILSVCSSWSVN